MTRPRGVRGSMVWRRARYCNGGDEVTQVDIHSNGLTVGIIGLAGKGGWVRRWTMQAPFREKNRKRV